MLDARSKSMTSIRKQIQVFSGLFFFSERDLGDNREALGV